MQQSRKFDASNPHIYWERSAHTATEGGFARRPRAQRHLHTVAALGRAADHLAALVGVGVDGRSDREKHARSIEHEHITKPTSIESDDGNSLALNSLDASIVRGVYSSRGVHPEREQRDQS